MPSGLHIPESILKDYKDLFGEKIVNGKRVIVEGLIEDLATQFTEEIKRVVNSRRKWLDLKEPVSVKGAFPSWDEQFLDADGNKLTFKEIVQGMIDNFLGRNSGLRWRLNEKVRIPDDAHPIKNAGLEITGPWYPLSRAFNQVNADVVSAMEDEEDASAAWYIPFKSGKRYADVWEARKGVKHFLSGDLPDPYYEKGKEYRIGKPRNKWPAIFHRLPGLHIFDQEITLNDKPVPAIIVSAIIYTLNNYENLKNAGSGVYFYVPKTEFPEEALVIEKILRKIEEKLGLQIGTIKIAMLYEEVNAGRYLPVILWIWRERLIKSNNGRWDYLGSLIEMWLHEKVLPDPQNITMTSPNMMAYQKYNALMMLLAGSKDGEADAAPVGGMAAVMLYSQTDPFGRFKYNQRALRGIKIDKLRERLIGLIFFADQKVERKVTLDDILNGKVKGKLYDLFRQSWVATKEREYVSSGNEPLRVSLEELQKTISRPVEYETVGSEQIPKVNSGLTPQERSLFQRLGLLDENGKITPWIITREMIDTPEKLFTSKELWGGKDLWHALYDVPDGEITPEHVQHAFYMAANYGFQLLNGNLAAAIDDYELKQRFMNDLATYRIFTSWLWSLINKNGVVTKDGYLKGSSLTKDGVIPAENLIKVSKGENVRDLFEDLWKLHYRWTNEFYKDFDVRESTRLIEMFSKSQNKKVLDEVYTIIAKAYGSGPFREMSPREASEKIAKIINADPKQVEDEIVRQAPRFDREMAPVIMEILMRLLTFPRYIQHNGKILFLLSPLDPETRSKVMDAIFSFRETVEDKVRRGELDNNVLQLYDYIYDNYE
ncbi:malate synthase [Candidatus Acidianus copahuensis]|uniref:malate synthase n=1 Tax=Candidatus Acidianus copahuensis TaxID=1160895 RepID=A0A031LKV5_9CREN|nr:malate synthase [Candidatus Acidianus copahuensis]EZQ01523.1 malate synthase [Candidatus Acidianus copahuensis]